MKKHTLPGGVILLCLLLLAGCRTLVPGVSTGFSGEDFSKAQKIVVTAADGTEKAVLAGEADIDAFVEAMNVEGWHMTDLPENLVQAGSFTLWQTETVTAFMGRDEAETVEICTFRCYQDEDYITIDTGLADISFTFSIPQTSADYLRGLLED